MTKEEYYYEILRFCVPWYMRQHHKLLLIKMHETLFFVSLKGRVGSWEEGRLWDGLYLRRDLSDPDMDIDYSKLPSVSVLEMWCGFLRRACGDILPHDSEKNMFMFTMQNLGLWEYDDDHYNEKAVNRILMRWLKRNYEKNGQGSPFPVRGFVDINMRRVDLWQQADMWWQENDPDYELYRPSWE